jgi:uncharacterized protein YdbL (DUF1318 family)
MAGARPRGGGCRARRLLVAALVASTAAACVPVTVNVTFPQEKLDDAASQIVDMSRQPPGGRPPSGPSVPAGSAPKPSSRLDRWIASVGPRAAGAESRVDVAQAPKTDTAELRRLTESQNRRLGELQQWLARGCVGENNQGFVEARPGQGCSGDVAKLIADENRDRQAIIQTFMRQNGIPEAEAGRVRASFARAHRDRVQAGQWLQTERGDWVKK